MRLEINYRKKAVKNTNTWRLNSALLNSQQKQEKTKKSKKQKQNKKEKGKKGLRQEEK